MKHLRFRAVSIGLGVALCAALGHVVAAGPTTAQAPPAASAEYREVNWDELIPKDWDPLKRFREMKLGGMSDADPRAQQVLKEIREAWNQAPINPALDDKAVRIAGYVVPLDDSKAGMREFLLVPYLGACIHTPPPPANQIIHVKPAQPAKGLQMMDAVWISGRLKTLRADTAFGVSGYGMQALRVEPYTDKPR